MNIFIVILPLSIFYMCIGIWEAIVASNDEPNNSSFSDNQKMAYAFTVVKCILNILTSITLLLINSIKEEDNKQENKNNYLSINLNFGVTIWGIVLYSYLINDESLYYPFNQVIQVEFFIFISIMSLFIILCCCLGLLNNSKNDNDSTPEIINVKIDEYVYPKVNVHQSTPEIINVVINKN